MNSIRLKSKRNHYFDDGQTIDRCPECEEELIEERNSVLLAVKSEKDEGQFITNIPTLRICPNCPVVVFDRQKLEEAAEICLRKGKKIQYAVLGIIDLSEGREFIKDSSTSVDEMPTPRPIYPLYPPPIIAPPKIGRNEKCPCGSGKKYKKCCLK